MSEAFFAIPYNGELLELSRENTSLFRHLGAAALYDHLFITQGESGGYIWRTHAQFEEIVELAEDAEVVTHSNIFPPAEIDVNNYIAHHAQDLDYIDGVPDEWVDETGR